MVQENWISRETANVPAANEDYEVRQRRNLVETWAKATQEFRDLYHNRAPLRIPGLTHQAHPEAALSRIAYSYPVGARLICLAPLSEASRSNRSKWIKLYILSCRLDGEMGHCLKSNPHAGIEPTPATFPEPTTFSMTVFLPWYTLETANFGNIVMTRNGSVLFLGCTEPWFLVDQNDLDTGRITTVQFENNGEILMTFPRRAYYMFPVYTYFPGLRKPLSEVKQSREGGVRPEQNAALDMTLPVIERLEGAKARGELIPFFDGARDTWTEDIDIYAPGYLLMEADGKEADHDHSQLIDPVDAYDIRLQSL
ncbi:hypothetical protein BO94DRAFT_617027 [Aspergillus sclerotioniger CBS 115572]|uniref:Uncharacterized protein n=1 Tax=Aspergillus sclerotioniger CBS 115572 TaxID=1450535 RepID=A0A317WZB1_9EURO|nr:hypothetical protein BO94DRAFT_617027 [Aspergillus sclerotioniger CBS 115572]PWY91709.1 hypothetical protein BO94DRAFT_617027 [Aspergillus sclerotioniger CBS 115572]